MAISNDLFDDGRGDSPRFLTTYSPPRPSIETLDLKTYHQFNMTLSEQTFLLLSEKYPKIKRVSTRPTIWEIDSKKCNIRSASQKSGDKYWFDVTPSLYEKNQVDYFIYICGSPKVIYVFPCDVFSDLIVGAHFGGQKKVPNFTIFDNIAEFEPAGQSHKRKNISKYRNNFSLISAINKDHLKIDFSYPEEVPSNIIEGAKQRITINSFERSKEAREKCIQHHGYNCTICGFNFLLHYGERGMNFIHVHHIIPISKIAESYIIDPIKDLRPVCPNCHAMIHRSDPPCSIDELKNLIKKSND